MKRVCAWCRKDLGGVDSTVHSAETITHGICRDCSVKLRLRVGMTVDEFIETLDTPVIATEVYNGRIIVNAANGSACEAVGKELREIKQHLAGNVFNCDHALLPEGCGKTIHCTGCAIRRSVMTTAETGEPLSMVPATLTRSDPDAQSSVVMYITTVKVGELVVLRVDRMESAGSSADGV